MTLASALAPNSVPTPTQISQLQSPASSEPPYQGVGPFPYRSHHHNFNPLQATPRPRLGILKEMSNLTATRIPPPTKNHTREGSSIRAQRHPSTMPTPYDKVKHNSQSSRRSASERESYTEWQTRSQISNLQSSIPAQYSPSYPSTPTFTTCGDIQQASVAAQSFSAYSTPAQPVYDDTQECPAQSFPVYSSAPAPALSSYDDTQETSFGSLETFRPIKYNKDRGWHR